MRILIGFCLLFGCAFASSDKVEEAKALYQHTRYEASLRILTSDHSLDATGYLLMGKDHFMLNHYGQATQFFEKALFLAPRNSECELWLGRTYGRRAETGGWVMAGPYASRARQHFEKAAELDPHNAEARNDLFDYYLNAPGILGGGLDKAEAIARQIAAERPAESQFELAQIAQRRKQYAEAEAHLRRAIELAPGDIGRILDLARYLAKRGRVGESDAVFAQARQMAPNDPRVVFARAQTYAEQRRNPEQVQELLHLYLEANLTPDDPSKSVAERLLREVGGR